MGIEAGPGTYIVGRPTILWNKYGSNIIIGNYTSIARGVTFFLGGHHLIHNVATRSFRKGHGYSKGDIRIGSDCWVGHAVTIMDGVTINDGAVIGACSVVAGDVPPFAVACGNPARVVKFRFTQDIIDRLLAVRWWDWEYVKIRRFVPLLSSPNIEEFLSKAEQDEKTR